MSKYLFKKKRNQEKKIDQSINVNILIIERKYAAFHRVKIKWDLFSYPVWMYSNSIFLPIRTNVSGRRRAVNEILLVLKPTGNKGGVSLFFFTNQFKHLSRRYCVHLSNKFFFPVDVVNVVSLVSIFATKKKNISSYFCSWFATHFNKLCAVRNSLRGRFFFNEENVFDMMQLESRPPSTSSQVIQNALVEEY